MKNENEKITDINPPIKINEKSYNSLSEKERKIVTNLEYEEQLNESKRNIKLLDVSQLGRLIDLVESVFE